jgi:hypothetical protein
MARIHDDTQKSTFEPRENEPPVDTDRDRRIQVNVPEGDDVTVIQFEREPLTDVSFGY